MACLDIEAFFPVFQPACAFYYVMDNVAGTDSRPPGMKVGAVFSATVGEQKGVFGIKFFFHMSSFLLW